MKTHIPKVIKLMARESELLQQIKFDSGHEIPEGADRLHQSAEAMVELAKSLMKRDAIPPARSKYFLDPAFHIGGHGKSRCEIFEGNGTRGDAILQHPHFWPYLRYFILGPDLPNDTISGFVEIINADAGTSGEVLEQLSSYARHESRKLGKEPYVAREEFYKLALECGLDDHTCRCVRDAAGQGTRTS